MNDNQERLERLLSGVICRRILEALLQHIMNNVAQDGKATLEEVLQAKWHTYSSISFCAFCVQSPPEGGFNIPTPTTAADLARAALETRVSEALAAAHAHLPPHLARTRRPCLVDVRLGRRGRFRPLVRQRAVPVRVLRSPPPAPHGGGKKGVPSMRALMWFTGLFELEEFRECPGVTVEEVKESAKRMGIVRIEVKGEEVQAFEA